MDLVKLVQDVITSPIMLAVGGVAAFVLGLVARPFIEARSGLFKDRASARTAFQRETLTELQKTLASTDPRILFEPLDYDPAQSIAEANRRKVAAHRLRVLTNQVRDRRVVAAMTAFLAFQDAEDGDDPEAFDRAYDRAMDSAHEAIANALRDL